MKLLAISFNIFFDIEAIAVKIYGYFKHITVRNTRLQDLFSGDDADVDEVKLLGYSNTRFIGLKNCINRIIIYFDLLKEFFENEKDAPPNVIKFFDHQLSKLLLIFVRDQCGLFESTITSIEGREIIGYEAATSVNWLIRQIESRRDEKYASFEFQREMDKVQLQLPFVDTILVKKGKTTQNEQVTVNDEYLEEMFFRFYGNYIKSEIFFLYIDTNFKFFRYFGFIHEEMGETYFAACHDI